MLTSRVIDCHCHYQQQVGFLERMIEGGRAAGVEKFCLNGGGSRWRQHGNDGVLAAAERHPECIIPFAFVDLGYHTAADVYAWHRAGFRGLKIQCPSAPYDDEAFFPLYAAAEECRLPVLFHTGVSARFSNHDRWNTSSAYMMIMHLDRVARCFSDLTIWAAHLGIPDLARGAMLMSVHPHLYCDLCGTDTAGERQPTLTHFGELFCHGDREWSKVVFGSEGGPEGFAPLLRDYQRLMGEAGLSEAIQQRVLWGNVAEALGLA